MANYDGWILGWVLGERRAGDRDTDVYVLRIAWWGWKGVSLLLLSLNGNGHAGSWWWFIRFERSMEMSCFLNFCLLVVGDGLTLRIWCNLVQTTTLFDSKSKFQHTGIIQRLLSHLEHPASHSGIHQTLTAADEELDTQIACLAAASTPSSRPRERNCCSFWPQSPSIMPSIYSTTQHSSSFTVIPVFELSYNSLTYNRIRKLITLAQIPNPRKPMLTSKNPQHPYFKAIYQISYSGAHFFWTIQSFNL